MAAAAGLPLVGENRRAEKTTTYGVGQLIEDALRNKCKKLIVGLGAALPTKAAAERQQLVGDTLYQQQN